MVTLSVVMPVFNEEKTVGTVIRRILSDVPYDLELIIVDDGSTDGTAAITDAFASQDPRVQVVHQSNAGKAGALKRGFERSRGEVVIIQDGDLEYDPAEITHVVEPILQGRADVTYGSRFMVRRAARVLYFYHYLANRFLTMLSNVLTNLNMTDIEITAKVAKLDAIIYEVPISYYGRTYEEGKKIGFWDGVFALWYILRFNLFCGLNRSFRVIPKRHAIAHDFSKRSAH